MRQFITFVKKEFAHILRDKKTLLILFGMPISQILIFGFALTNEVKNVKIAIVDRARDEQSRRLISKIDASKYFEVKKILGNAVQVDNELKKGTIKMAVIFPANFSSDLAHYNTSQVQIVLDGSDPNTANTIKNYITAIVTDHQRQQQSNVPALYQIIPEVRMLYNPQLLDAPNFVPGVMALVLMLVCVMMTAVSIVKEKEMGNMEILLVSPIKPGMVILTKTFPYLVLSLVNLTIILLLSIFVLKLPVNGSLVLLFAESILFIITCLTLGIFISVKTSSQEVAMLISLMGMLIPTILFSGFMFPIENMPYPLQMISNIIPSKWYYIIVKSIMIKGLGFSAIWKETLVLATITSVLLAVSLKSFKIRLE
ncbi:ABC transporter permease [Pedobacter ginsengisoli]|uniref:ABC transporter permease n=1 Tax=Pedobacter ginsengisoli TaxID=363852 RepID=UPI00254E7387|nr:ABC transporter permease [Pedobacter ginsengisoli]